MEFLVVLEKTENNWAACSPDVSGCVVTGRTPKETVRRYEKALLMHLQGLREDGLPLPVPTAMATMVELAV